MSRVILKMQISIQGILRKHLLQFRRESIRKLKSMRYQSPKNDYSDLQDHTPRMVELVCSLVFACEPVLNRGGP